MHMHCCGILWNAVQCCARLCKAVECCRMLWNILEQHLGHSCNGIGVLLVVVV